LFIRDGSFYTSAGITAGIDLSLSMIEEDSRAAPSLSRLRGKLVVFREASRRARTSSPSRFRFQSESADRFSDLAAWIATKPAGRSLDKTHWPREFFLSSRQFSRAFKTKFQATPAAFVEETRLAEATRRLSSQRVTVDLVAHSVWLPDH